MWHMWTTQLGWIPHIYLPNAMTKNCTLWKPTNHHIFDHLAYILFAPSLLKIGTIQIGSIEQGSLQAGIRHWILMGLIFDRLPLHLTSHFATDGHRKTPCLEVAFTSPQLIAVIYLHLWHAEYLQVVSLHCVIDHHGTNVQTCIDWVCININSWHSYHPWGGSKPLSKGSCKIKNYKSARTNTAIFFRKIFHIAAHDDILWLEYMNYIS